MTAPSTITLRREACPADRDAIRAIVTSTEVFSPVEIDVAVELIDDRLKRGEQSDYHFVFADADNQTIGYTCYGPIALTASSYDLYWIAVSKTAQGKKVGQLLLEQTETLIRQRGGRQVYIETSNREQYLPTRGFYLRGGYVQAALLQDFYAIGDDKVIYEKVLA